MVSPAILLTSANSVDSMNSIRPSNICALLAKCRYSAASETSSFAASAAVVIRSPRGASSIVRQRLQDLEPSFSGMRGHRVGPRELRVSSAAR